ncbi:MAG: pilus assembly protein MshP [Pseudomonadota bacterium]
MTRRSQNGFSLVPALFLIIVLAALGIVAVRMSVISSQTVVLTMQGSRADAAARSGVEWAIYQALVNNSCVASSSLALTEGGLSGFSVDVSCASASFTEGQDTVTVYTLEAFASSGAFGQPDYVSRRVRTTVTDVS